MIRSQWRWSWGRRKLLIWITYKRGKTMFAPKVVCAPPSSIAALSVALNAAGFCQIQWWGNSWWWQRQCPHLTEMISVSKRYSMSSSPGNDWPLYQSIRWAILLSQDPASRLRLPLVLRFISAAPTHLCCSRLWCLWEDGEWWWVCICMSVFLCVGVFCFVHFFTPNSCLTPRKCKISHVTSCIVVQGISKW